MESLFLENGLINISRFITFSFIHLFVFKWFFKFSRDGDLTFLMDYKRERVGLLGSAFLLALRFTLGTKRELEQNRSTVLIKKETEL